MESDKPTRAANVPTATGTGFSRGQVAHEQIARRAEQLWRERGSPQGQDETIWLEAEAELKAKSESKPVSGTAAQPSNPTPAPEAGTRSKTRDAAEAKPKNARSR